MRNTLSSVVPPWLLLWLCLPVLTAAGAQERALLSSEAVEELGWDFPSSITLRAGVLHAPPFATVEIQPQDDNPSNVTTVRYGGFQYDLLQRLQVFAAHDNVELHFELSPAPDQYETALDLVALDCASRTARISTSTPPETKCNQLDLIVGDYYATPERALRVDTSPAWLRSTISTIKYLDKQNTTSTRDNNGYDVGVGVDVDVDVTTLTQASNTNATVCLRDGTFYASVVKAKYPGVDFLMCSSQDSCLAALKAEECALYAEDELQLRYRAAWDYTLEVTREQVNTQYIVWPMSYKLDPIITMLMKRWMYAAITNATLDELYHTYFQKALCPVGTAGESCELPCDPIHGTSDARGVCVCQSNKWTGDACSIEVPEDRNDIPLSMKYISYSMLTCNGVVICICAMWLYTYRHTAQVRASQPFFLMLVLLGCMISSSTIIAMAQQDDSTLEEEDYTTTTSVGSSDACIAIPWLYSVGFSVTFGTLFAKILRVYRIFTQAAAQRNDFRTFANRRNFVTVTFKETLMVIWVVLCIDVAILIAWTLLDPLRWERIIISADQFGAPLESQAYCTSDSWKIFGGMIGAFHLGLLTVACYLCYRARNIPTKFSEGKYVTIAMISNLQIFVVAVPVLIILGTDPKAGFFVRSVVIWMNDLAVVTVIFGNLMYSVFTTSPEDRNRASLLKKDVSKAITQYCIENQRSMSSTKTPPQEQISQPSPGVKQLSGKLQCPVAMDVIHEAIPEAEAPSTDFEISEPFYASNGPVKNVPISDTKPSISSLTQGSRKSVSWGMAFYSEGNAETAIPVTTPPESNEFMNCHDHDIEHGSEPFDTEIPKGSCRFESTFAIHPVQDAPQMPYKRPSKERSELSSLRKSFDSGDNINDQGLIRPNRADSVGTLDESIQELTGDSFASGSLASDDISTDGDDALSIDAEPCQHPTPMEHSVLQGALASDSMHSNTSSKAEKSEQPPQLPLRRPSSSRNLLEEEKEALESGQGATGLQPSLVDPVTSN